MLAIAGVDYRDHTLYFRRDLPELPAARALSASDGPEFTRATAGSSRYATATIFVPIQAIPKTLVNAFLSARTKLLQPHASTRSLSCAPDHRCEPVSANRRPVGASTITQQVARMLLSNRFIERRQANPCSQRGSRLRCPKDASELLTIYLGSAPMVWPAVRSPFQQVARRVDAEKPPFSPVCPSAELQPRTFPLAQSRAIGSWSAWSRRQPLRMS